MARYLLLIHDNEAYGETAEEAAVQARDAGHDRWRIEQQDVLLDGGHLKPSATATTVRENGQGGRSTTPGSRCRMSPRPSRTLTASSGRSCSPPRGRDQGSGPGRGVRAGRLYQGSGRVGRLPVPYRIPDPEDLPERVETVLSVVDLLFTTGHTAPSGDQLVLTELVDRATLLARAAARPVRAAGRDRRRAR